MLRSRFLAILAAALVASAACVVMALPAHLESTTPRTQGDPIIVGHGGSKAGGRLGHEDVFPRAQLDSVIVGHGKDKKPTTLYSARTQGDPIIVGHRPGSAIMDGVAAPRTQGDPIIVGHGGAKHAAATQEDHPALTAVEPISNELFEELDKDDVKLQAWLDARDAERLNVSATTTRALSGKHGIAVLIKRPWPLYPGCHSSWPDWEKEGYIIPPNYLMRGCDHTVIITPKGGHGLPARQAGSTGSNKNVVGVSDFIWYKIGGGHGHALWGVYYDQ